RDEENSKLVSFADSRQDAANAALDLEKRHHEDVRRELLVSELMQAFESRPDKSTLEEKLKELKTQAERAMASKSIEQVGRILNERADIERQLAGYDDSVPIADVIDLVVDSQDLRTRPALARMVKLGIHPTDPAGVAAISVDDPAIGKADFAWEQLFISASQG